ncbi:MAG: heparan-alpha-glucosaminide N-acetyltransferase [Chthoniobacter sp.]|jgi:predicted acyltransferase|nr:heparan-alpha-glucosaminide N-acetyltransferase [Chthoniobacter sp.]
MIAEVDAGQTRVEFANRPAPRLASIDAYRGLVMLLMMAEVLALGKVVRAVPESAFWKFLLEQQTHVEWTGAVLHDLIQPSFSFLVGVALPFALAGRLARGQSLGKMLAHAAWRSLLLIALGIGLRSIGRPQTYFTFEDTLSQIGLGYFFLFLLGLGSVRVQWMAFVLIGVGYWAAFAVFPLPGSDFDWVAAGVPPDWPHHAQGFAAHWNKNTNLAWAFDRWFLNLFPREKVFTNNPGGYATLSFIPTLGTMILGLIAGGWLRSSASHREKLTRFCIGGGAGLLVGLALHCLGVCPLVKRIWTPGWVLFSGGCCFLFLAAFYAIIDVKNLRGWAFPLMVVGMNAIAAYCMAHLFERFLIEALNTHLGGILTLFAPYDPFVRGALVLVIFWLILFWMFRRKLFLKV